MEDRTMLTHGIAHSDEAVRLHERVLRSSSLHGRHLDHADGRQVHVLKGGQGPPLVLLHGTANSGLFFLPLLERLKGVRVIAPDRPGQGLSDRAELPLVTAGERRSPCHSMPLCGRCCRQRHPDS
jgi:pimeloyl-ACP methyl ester carboxylesterase